MKYICAQPETIYYKWQVDTMITSFLQNGVAQSDIIILSNKETNEFYALREKYPKASFYRYDAPAQTYPPAIKPYLMHKYFTDHQEDEQYFYCDCDIILTKPLPNFEDGIFMSNTVSYIGYDYIKSKGQEIVNIVCNTVGIDELILISEKNNSGGCQFIFHTLNAKVWEKAYEDSNKLWKNINEYNSLNTDKYEGTYPLQAWTSEMWATLYAMWYYGYYGKVDPRLDFAWSTDEISRLENTSILHNAGVSTQKDLFRKSNYMRQLPPCNLVVDPTKCSSYYYKKVKEVICNS